jgi:type IV pilus assembly protein PilY1
MHVDSAGAKTFQYIDAGPGPANGIVEVTAADLDGDHVTDFVYAGDVLGNVWRFDLTSSSSSNWSTAVTKMFTTNSGQPITTAPVVVEIPSVSNTRLPRLIIAFGTGQKLPLTSTASEVYSTGTQSIYGFWDSKLSAWNATSTDEKYDTSAVTYPLSPSNLTAQSFSANTTGADGATYRTVTANTLCWQGASICSSGNTSMGYKLDLPGSNEQIIYNPSLIDDSFVVNTLMPQSTQALTCGVTPASGFTVAIDIINGSGDNSPYTDGTNYFAATAQNGSGAVTQYNYNGKSYDGTETNTGGWVSKKHVRRGGVVSRITWTKVR